MNHEDVFDVDGAHFRLAPSGSGRWRKCHGSARAVMPDTSSEASDLGTITHGISSSRLLQRPDLMPDLTAVPADQLDEMMRVVDVYVDFCQNGIKAYHGVEWEQATSFVERRIASRIVDEFGGTTDFLRVTDRYLHVVDLKYGVYPVDVADNSQLKCYLCLARELYPGRETYYGTIIQPRVFNEPQHAQFTNAELDEHLVSIIEASVSTELTAGAHCRFCPFLETCEVADREMTELASRDFDNLDVARWVRTLEFAPVVKRLEKLARTAMRNYMLDGSAIEGWKLVQRHGRRKWRQGFEETLEKLIGLGLSREEVVKTTIQSPRHVELLTTRESVAELWEKPALGLTVAPDECKLEGVTDDFDVIESDDESIF